MIVFVAGASVCIMVSMTVVGCSVAGEPPSTGTTEYVALGSSISALRGKNGRAVVNMKSGDKVKNE